MAQPRSLEEARAILRHFDLGRDLVVREAQRAFRHFVDAHDDMPPLRAVRWGLGGYRDNVDFDSHFPRTNWCWTIPRRYLPRIPDGNDYPQEVFGAVYMTECAEARVRREVECLRAAAMDIARYSTDRAAIEGAVNNVAAVEREIRERVEQEMTDVSRRVFPEPPQTVLTIGNIAAMRAQVIQTAAFDRFNRVLADLVTSETRRNHQATIARSITLLTDWLSPVQLEEYERTETFHVTGSKGGRYRIRGNTGPSYNVERLDKNGGLIEELCFQPSGAPAIGDILLAQKITLETDELSARRVANVRQDGFVTPYGMSFYERITDMLHHF